LHIDECGLNACGAYVKVRNLDLGYVRETFADGSGYYEVTVNHRGEYKIKAEGIYTDWWIIKLELRHWNYKIFTID